MILPVRLQTWCFGSKGQNNPRLSFSSIRWAQWLLRWAQWLLLICTPYIPPPPHTLFESLSASKRYYWAISWLRGVLLCFYCWMFHQLTAWYTQHISSTPILGLCYGVFTDQFIFRLILGQIFPRKENLYRDYVRIRSIRYQKGKLNVIKRQKTSILGL